MKRSAFMVTLSKVEHCRSGHNEVKNFLVTFPNGASDQLLQLEEDGSNAEQSGDGGNTYFGSFGGIEDQR